jgi:ubiquinone/menaquinone biosynthesis C-methylase UbiE
MNKAEAIKRKQAESHKSSYAELVKNDASKSYLHVDNTHAWARNYPVIKLEKFFRTLIPGTSLTIGDGKGGHEAQFLKRFGFYSVASDIAVEMLQVAVEENLIDQYLEVDAESMALDDSSFDLVIIKESLHHLPRPYLCIYEMLRITSDMAIFIEPNGDHCYRIGNEAYESSGNYKYQFTRKELVQTCVCMGYTNVAIGYSPNVNYLVNCSFLKNHRNEIWLSKEKRPEPGVLSGRLLPETVYFGSEFEKYKAEYENSISEWVDSHPLEVNPLIVCIVSKKGFSESAKKALEEQKYEILSLKANPYL